MLIGVMLTACSSTSEPPPDDMPVLHETTLERFDGTPISIEELDSLRPSALATAETIARIDRLLLEPWAEQRDSRIFLENLRAAHPSDTRLGQTLWETTEPAARGNGRDMFREFGFFANQFTASGFGPRTRPSTLEGYIKKVLDGHTDADAQAMLLAAWRRFAPLVQTREAGYLSSSWQLELDYVAPVSVTLNDSLLGPFDRTAVDGKQASFFGPTDGYEGYTASVMLLDLLTPGPASPVRRTVEELQQLATGDRSRLSVGVSEGVTEQIDDTDVEFLGAAAAGLLNGCAKVESLPQSVRTLDVVFSYLIDHAEARANLRFVRTGGKWELQLFEYEPAAANMVGNGARLDLMPTIRALILRNRQG